MGILSQTFLALSLIVCFLACYLWAQDLLSHKKRVSAIASKLESFITDNRVVTAMWLVITFVAIFARLWRFWEIPYGLNQDEASIGYDSYALGLTGYDRNGFHLPIYPIAFGAGHGPFYTYLAIPAIKIFGLSLFSLRLTNALLSCVAVVVFYFLAKRITNSRGAALIGYGFAAVTPTLIISARWALDGSPPPSLIIIALFLFVVAVDSGKTLWYAVAAAFFGLICYSYGPLSIVVVVFLALSCVYLNVRKKITLKQLGVSVIVFLVVVAPLAVFMLRNFMDMPAIHAFISFPRFTALRTSNTIVDKVTFANFANAVNVVLAQPNDMPWNTVNGYGTTYLFSAPLIVFGLVVLLTRLKIKAYSHNFIILAYVCASVIMSGLIRQNINRLSAIYPCVVILIMLAIHELWRRKRILAVVLCAFSAVSFCMFANDYFGQKYKDDFGRSFFYTFGDALEYAIAKTDSTIYVTEHKQNEPSIITLFYSRISPEKFYDTVKYYDDNAEFRNAIYFDRFIFRIPEEKDPSDVYVIDNDEIGNFDMSLFDRQTFTYYSVMYPKSGK